MASMNCTLSVKLTNHHRPGWANALKSVLYDVPGVTTVKVDGYGFVHVTGFDVHPETLIWKLSEYGYQAFLCSTQSGNGYSLNNKPWYHDHDYYDDHHDRLRGYYRPFARLAFELRRRFAAPPPPPPMPRMVYVPRRRRYSLGCCGLM